MGIFRMYTLIVDEFYPSKVRREVITLYDLIMIGVLAQTLIIQR